ncbi:MAG TPA: Gfo/Idh/MocA family oxidoreductase [Capsulimonadaceae bacterium]|jgi:predicted dehydrogenase
MAKIRVGFIGVGGIAQGHISRLAALDDVEIVAIADPNEESVTKSRERHVEQLADVAAYSDYRDLLERSRPEAVVICTPHTQHCAQALDSLDAGAHVLLEKPMVCNVPDARKILSKIDQTGKVFGLAYQRHTSADFRYIRTKIMSGEVGAVQSINAIQQQDWKRLTIGTWRQVPELSGGGQINDSGSHLLDVILWATGLAPEYVSAFIDNKGTPVDINSSVNVKFLGGATATLNIVGDAPKWYEDVTIWCESGAFYVRNGGQFTEQLADGTFHTPEADPTVAISDISTNFIRAIQGTEEIAAPAICGLRTIELTEAAWQSGAAGGALTAVNRSAV